MSVVTIQQPEDICKEPKYSKTIFSLNSNFWSYNIDMKLAVLISQKQKCLGTTQCIDELNWSLVFYPIYELIYLGEICSISRDKRGSEGQKRLTKAERRLWKNTFWLSFVPTFEVDRYLLDMIQLGVNLCMCGRLRVVTGRWGSTHPCTSFFRELSEGRYLKFDGGVLWSGAW